MSNFISGIVFGALLFGAPRIILGTYVIYDTDQGGWVMKWQTFSQRLDAYVRRE